MAGYVRGKQLKNIKNKRNYDTAVIEKVVGSLGQVKLAWNYEK